ncbi:secreted protein [methanotrophic bacterial endosymbiont of Bathymodiolus sp.]|nr:secreted protein [methanotrophic bacterial endosymbiont of Bathymodiolus sp.]
MSKFILLPLFLSLFIVSCANANPSDAPTTENEAKPVTYMGTGTLNIAPVVFAKDLQVRDAVRNECQLLTKLPGFVQSYAQDQYAGINLNAKRSTKSDFLEIKIIDLPKYKKMPGQGVVGNG